MYALETQHLRKAFDDKVAVDDLTLAVERGEVFGFLGPNGAGKTTSIKMLLGLITPSGGEARLLGAPLGDVAVRGRTGFLPEHFRFHDWLSAAEFLALHADLYHIPRPVARQRIGDLLERVGLAPHASKKLRQFSKGMLQRIGLAQALLNQPELVFLDEPTSGLDPVGRRLVRDLIRELREGGTTVFLNSHLLSEVEITCDRVAFIKHGVVLRISPLKALVEGELSVSIQVRSLAPEALRGLERWGLEPAPGWRASLADPGERERPAGGEPLFGGARRRGLRPAPTAYLAGRPFHPDRRHGWRLMSTFTIARLTFREAPRRKILLAALLLGLLFLAIYGTGFYLLLTELRREEGGQLSALQANEIRNFLLLAGLYVVNFLSMMMTVLTSVDTLSGEITSGTIHTLVSKPIRRWEILLGKWLGFAGMLSLYLLLMAGGTMLLVYLISGYIAPHSLRALALMLLNALLLLERNPARGQPVLHPHQRRAGLWPVRHRLHRRLDRVDRQLHERSRGAADRHQHRRGHQPAAAQRGAVAAGGLRDAVAAGLGHRLLSLRHAHCAQPADDRLLGAFPVGRFRPGGEGV